MFKLLKKTLMPDERDDDRRDDDRRDDDRRDDARRDDARRDDARRDDARGDETPEAEAGIVSVASDSPERDISVAAMGRNVNPESNDPEKKEPEDSRDIPIDGTVRNVNPESNDPEEKEREDSADADVSAGGTNQKVNPVSNDPTAEDGSGDSGLAGDTGLAARFGNWLDESPEGPLDADLREKALGTMGAVEAALADGGDATALFELVMLASDYDRAVSEAEAIGEIRGRNMKIEEIMDLQFDGDGVPHPGVGGNIYDAPAPGIFELARCAR